MWSADIIIQIIVTGAGGKCKEKTPVRMLRAYMLKPIWKLEVLHAGFKPTSSARKAEMIVRYTNGAWIGFQMGNVRIFEW